MTLALDMHHCANRHSFVVTFTGTMEQACANALRYLNGKGSTHTYHLANEMDYALITDELATFLYPLCHHGMDLQMCMDPIGDGHFGTYEQDRLNGDW